jgi:hypothetical protein
LNFAAANAGSTDADPLAGALNYGANALQIDVPPAVAHIVSVADAVPELGTTAANFTHSRHWDEISSKSLNLDSTQ